MLVRLSLISALAAAIVAANGNTNIPVPWALPFNNTRGVGPDGPWNFLTMTVGDNPVDFFPALSPGANLLVQQKSCDALGAWCLNPQPQNAGLPPDNKTTFPSDAYNNGTTSNLMQLTGDGVFDWRDDFKVPFPVKSLQCIYTNNTLAHLPARSNGRTASVPLSLLTLEPHASHLQISGSTGQSLLGQYLLSTKSSSSIGMTFGSVAFNQPASLYFSGYDQNRIIEPPAVFDHTGAVDIASLSFGTESGVSPWANAKNVPNNFVALSTGKQLQTIISPQTPYINLPSAVCRSIATFLPVTFDSDTGLYLWNTSDPAYEAIVTSPSYLNFTFGGTHPGSVRVPFALLNLTLDAPLKSKPTPYFPCRDNNVASMPNALGRAFLQSAYVMQSFDPQTLAIAQAPGPSVNGTTASTPNVITVKNASPSVITMASPPKWLDTWAGILKPLDKAPSSPNSGNASSTDGSFPPSSGGNPSGTQSGNPVGDDTSSTQTVHLTTAAIAGIAAGSAAVVCLVIALVLVILLMRRRRSGSKELHRWNSLKSSSSCSTPPSYRNSRNAAGWQPEMYAVGPGGQILPNAPPKAREYGAYEMTGEGQIGAAEIDGKQVRAEVGIEGQKRAELDQDHGSSWRRFTRELGFRAGTVGQESHVQRPSIAAVGGREGGPGRGFRQVRSDDWERYGDVLGTK